MIHLPNARLGVALLLCALVAPWPALAQTSYACTTARGESYRSLNPCPRVQPPGLIHYAPTSPGPSSHQAPVQRIERAGDELGYMSPKCATLQDGIRTAPNRGLSATTIREMRQNFDRECSEERREAMNAARKNQQLDEKRRREEQEVAQLQKLRSVEDQERYRQQCAEMRLSIQRRKQRVNPTEGELSDLALFEERYQSRCKPA